MKFILLSFIFGHFCTPGSGQQTQLNPDPDLERNTATVLVMSKIIIHRALLLIRENIDVHDQNPL
jgi:hypothetical protein